MRDLSLERLAKCRKALDIVSQHGKDGALEQGMR
jgi:hypothetical protein